VTLPVAVQLVIVPQHPVLQAAVLESLRVAVALICTEVSSAMVDELGAIVMLETVLLTVMSDVPYWPLLIAMIVQDPPVHFGTELAVTRPLMLTVQSPVGIHVMVLPQQFWLQTEVVPSLRVAKAYNWKEPVDGMVADDGRMATPITVSSLVTVMLETLLVCPLLVAVTVPEPPTHPGTWLPVTRPLAPTVIFPVGVQVVVALQQPVLQATVLASLRVAVALI
jgi:hypothetical protein